MEIGSRTCYIMSCYPSSDECLEGECNLHLPTVHVAYLEMFAV